MSERQYTNIITPFDNETGNKLSAEIDVRFSRFVTISISTSGTASFLFRVRGAIQDDTDFTQAAGQLNQWDFVSFTNLSTGTVVNGQTGISYGGVDAVNIIELNVSGLTKIALLTSSYVAGNFTAKVKRFDAQ